MRFVSKSPAYIMIILLLVPLFGIQTNFWPLTWGTVSAESCQTNSEEPIWGLEAENITMYNYMWAEYNDDDLWVEDSRNSQDEGSPADNDKDLMYPYYTKDRSLGVLTEDDDFHVTQYLQNDSATGLRLNLSVGQKYTFCVTAQNFDNDTILGKGEVDVYLMTEEDWERYEWDFSERHEEWREFFSDVPPEWRSSIDAYTFWMPFRDTHAYEKVSEQQFSVALDHNEIDSGDLWDDRPRVVYESFYLVVDSWDNGRDNDAKPNGNQVSVDISVVIDSRISLWNWTVSLVCGGMLLGIAAIPIIINMRYKKKGIDEERIDLMPALETEAKK